MLQPRSFGRPQPPPPADNWALFLDVDGCLLEIAETPDAVRVPPSLRPGLAALAAQLDGALALVSGRSLAAVDALLDLPQLPAAGLHGLERRHAGGRGHGPPSAPAALASVTTAAEALVARHPGTLVEYKGPALALHWRAAPASGPALAAFATAVLPRLPGYRLQHGSQVVEIRPAAHGQHRADKGASIIDFMDEPPFTGRVPVFAGDDLTDEAGFAAVNARGGISVLVGRPRDSAAHFALPGPAEVLAWLGMAA
ncbi:trehalose-phosphatase [Luteimonas sp. MC1782]|uniref:trehalose-phosphatase n=1 Tax=Luteimonas sp. MC1782 TaxID=2760305 RepID=UPI001601A19E|nr:trehalose-phosphatase [Luteimonas sp. MC1782]MBB1473792.1 trehalose-phosphatase [Luteimonas sp. MC1782]